MKDYKYVKQIFKQYEGSYFHMIRDGVYEEYKSYQVPREVELKWNYNKQEELKKILLETQNNKVIVDIFQKYRNYAAHLNDEKALEFMLEYVCEHMVNWDSSTVLKNVNVILNSIDFLKTRNKKRKVIKKCIQILQEVLKYEISISNDCEENNQIKNSLFHQEMINDIYGSIRYWKRMLWRIKL